MLLVEVQLALSLIFRLIGEVAREVVQSILINHPPVAVGTWCLVPPISYITA